ncbi:30S ribosomal protein S12 methylthiotransferase RimO [Clostridium sp. 19966]|uniref:30S ribosomal protein S12 methylthiotransferase RimO n=1 Tax=Clostridium sp. 19966 TaxID=2768166 RepID=UPI0028E0294D|nr:30S ribosomal protein S12 methylthiotransferase RimO [Clostridium sp. 19966]MDT8716407.1 30S ribosomal protein S12 methylthiotransferase RimO [Clostridium sp. 19966]
MIKYKVGIISLGCDKNRIDTEIILGNLKDKFEITNNPKEAQIIIVNTCGFIETSKQESINTIFEMAEYKHKYKCEVLIATGCLTQRYNKEIQELMPEVDIILGVNDYNKIKECIDKFYQDKNRILLCSSNENNFINEGKRIISTGKNYAYIRIGEGCNNNCTYCAIPSIRGRYRSRSIENIVDEAKNIVEQGIKEIILVAQDTTMFGIDIYGRRNLPVLLKELSKIENLHWIRLLYCYPEEITDDLIDEIQNNPKVCKYIDIPIQHISNNVLKRMGRRGSKEDILSVIRKLRSKIPNIAIRSTFIVGFPGESESDFNELKEFVKEEKIDNLGVFRFSPEEGTAAANMTGEIEDDIKIKREKEIMLTQKQIVADNNRNKIGNCYEILIEEYDGNYFIGRNQYMCPDIDGIVYVKSESELKIGEFVKVEVTDALEYDLVGDVYYESCK